MPKIEWVRVGIEDVCELIVDCLNRTAPVVEYETPYRMIRTTNVKAGWIDLSSVKYVTEEVYEKWTRRAVPRKGDVILTREAPLGEVGMLREDNGVFLGQRLVMYRADPSKVNPYFLLYSFLQEDVQGQIKSFGSGATVEHMRVPDAKKITLVIPQDINVQNKIAGILSAYDDLIENNTQRIKALEAAAQALYREWFVEFRFPGHESVAWVASALGDIPAGWEVIELKAILNLIHGFAFRSSQFTDSPNQRVVVRMGNFKASGGLQFQDNTKYLVDDDFKEKFKLEPGDLLMVFSDVTREGGIIGKVGFVPDDENTYILNQRVVRIDTPKIYESFLYFYFNSSEFNIYCLSRADSATVLNLSNGHIYDHKVILPKDEIMAEFRGFAESVLEELELLQKKNILLRLTRDQLLPRLIAGELDVSELEIELDDVTA